jgi:hypothetical protein
MTYGKIIDGVLIQKQPNPEDGFVEIPDDVVVGYLLVDGELIAPPAPEEPPFDPLTQTLTKRQVNAALILGANVLSPDAFVRTALDAIEDPVGKALALNDWETAPYFERGHPLFTNEQVLVAAGMSPAAIDALWALGWQQPK